MSKVNEIYRNLIFSSTSYWLKNLTILNSEATIHVFNDLSWFSNFWKALHEEYIIVRDSHISILEYDDIALQLKKNDWILKLKNVIYCINFAVNLVSFSHLMNKAGDRRDETFNDSSSQISQEKTNLQRPKASFYRWRNTMARQDGSSRPHEPSYVG